MTVSVSPGVTKVGFVGLGVMGKAMARNILRAGFSLHVANRSQASVRELAAEGATPTASPAELARICDVVMICLPDTPDVEAVLFGPNELAEHARPDFVVIDTSTISATATRTFAERLAAKGAYLIDCPVSGGPKGAVDGTLSCMIGGDAGVVQACQPLFNAIGNKHVYLGESGAGQLVKACNQLVIAATLAGVSEAIALAKSAGVDPLKMRDVLLGGSAQSFVLQNHAKRLLDRTLAPGFRSSLMLKDLKLALAAGRDASVFMPTTTLAAQLFTALCNSEKRELDSAALGLMVQELSGLSGE
jgi:2-hydroxy-3-oxopropionate reductase